MGRLFHGRCLTQWNVSSPTLMGTTDKRVVVAFPPARTSSALKRVASGYLFIGADALSSSVFPDEFVKPDGYVLHASEVPVFSRGNE